MDWIWIDEFAYWIELLNKERFLAQALESKELSFLCEILKVLIEEKKAARRRDRAALNYQVYWIYELLVAGAAFTEVLATDPLS